MAIKIVIHGDLNNNIQLNTSVAAGNALHREEEDGNPNDKIHGCPQINVDAANVPPNRDEDTNHHMQPASPIREELKASLNFSVAVTCVGTPICLGLVGVAATLTPNYLTQGEITFILGAPFLVCVMLILVLMFFIVLKKSRRLKEFSIGRTGENTHSTSQAPTDHLERQIKLAEIALILSIFIGVLAFLGLFLVEYEMAEAYH